MSSEVEGSRFDHLKVRRGILRLRFAPLRMTRIGDSSYAEQPLHVVSHAIFERKSRLVSKRISRAGKIGLRKVLIMRVRIIEVFGLKICAQTFV